MGRSATALALAAATTAAGLALWQALEHRVPLGILFGRPFWLLVTWLAISLLLGLRILARELAAIRAGQAGSRPPARLRSLFVFAVLSWLAFLGLVDSLQKLWLVLFLGAAAGAWVAWIANERAVSRLPERLRKATGFGLFSLAASALLLESSLRVYALARPSPLLARLGDPPRVAVERARFEPGHRRLGSTCNQRGHFDEEFSRKDPGERLVVTIGDSFSVGVVPHRYHFTTVCEEILGVRVDNMGIAGVNPPEYLGMLVDEALPLDPDLVVIDVFVGNDLVFPGRRRGKLRALAESWLERENVLFWVLPKRLARIAEERALRARAGGEVAGVQDESDGGPGTIEERFPWVLDPSLEKETFSEAAFLSVENQRARDLAALKPISLEPFFDTMLEMERAAGSIPLCVMLIPDEFQVEDELWDRLVAANPDVTLHRDRTQEWLRSWFEEHDIPCLDLLPILRAVEPMADGRRRLYHLRDTHFNARGNRAAGQALAEFLRTKLPLPRER